MGDGNPRRVVAMWWGSKRVERHVWDNRKEGRTQLKSSSVKASEVKAVGIQRNEV